jgi:hypothetical protein
MVGLVLQAIPLCSGAPGAASASAVDGLLIQAAVGSGGGSGTAGPPHVLGQYPIEGLQDGAGSHGPVQPLARERRFCSFFFRAACLRAVFRRLGARLWAGITVSSQLGVKPTSCVDVACLLVRASNRNAEGPVR